MSVYIQGVMVTGATTPIGERLIRSLLADEGIESVLAIGIEPEDEAPLPQGFGDRLTYVSVDLGRSRRVRNLLFGVAKELGVEVVIHTSMHRDAKDSGGRVHAQNVDALRSLLDLGERHPTIRRLVFKSHAEVYQVKHDLPILVTENHPLNMTSGSPQWIRDRVEADLTACARMGLSSLEIAVLRCAEVLAPGCGSQIWDWLDASVALRPVGFDPMTNVLSIDDAVRALELAGKAFGVQGVFNIPGKDTLPLSSIARQWGVPGMPVPGGLASAFYRTRRRLRGHDFSYGMNRRRFHFCSVLDGTRARQVLGYVPRTDVDWPITSGDPAG